MVESLSTARIPDGTPRPMRFAYADPPYLGLCSWYDHQHETWGCWDDINTHAALLDHLEKDFDGWALSLTQKNLRDILPLTPADVRIGSWVKPFASFKPGVRVAYAWEPVIFRAGRTISDPTELTFRDYLIAPMAMRRGLPGAKPEKLMRWVLDLLGYAEGDEVIDLFPGTGVMGLVEAQGVLL